MQADLEEPLPVVVDQFTDTKSFLLLTDEEFENIQSIFDITVSKCIYKLGLNILKIFFILPSQRLPKLEINIKAFRWSTCTCMYNNSYAGLSYLIPLDRNVPFPMPDILRWLCHIKKKVFEHLFAPVSLNAVLDGILCYFTGWFVSIIKPGNQVHVAMIAIASILEEKWAL